MTPPPPARCRYCCEVVDDYGAHLPWCHAVRSAFDDTYLGVFKTLTPQLLARLGKATRRGGHYIHGKAAQAAKR